MRSRGFSRTLCIMALLVPGWLLAAGAALGNPTIRFVTNFGNFEVELLESQAPLTVTHFLSHVTQGFYRDTLFHRLVPGVLLQGGAYSSTWQLKAGGERIPNEGENGVSNSKWTLAMSHGSDPHAASTEFFINLGDNSDFDHGAGNPGTYYCVFGEVSEGHDTIRKMVESGAMAGGDFIGDRPVQDIILNDIILISEN